jgi:hypothetical protein
LADRPIATRGHRPLSIRLRQNPDVWLADILLAALPTADGSAWVVGGDFNMSETFDAWSAGPRGNREYLARIADRRSTECLRKATGRRVSRQMRRRQPALCSDPDDHARHAAD